MSAGTDTLNCVSLNKETKLARQKHGRKSGIRLNVHVSFTFILLYTNIQLLDSVESDIEVEETQRIGLDCVSWTAH